MLLKCASEHRSEHWNIPYELHDGGEGLAMAKFGSLERLVMFRCDMGRS